MKEINILGIKINDVSFTQAINIIEKFLLSKKPRQIATVNSEFIMAAQKDEEFRHILNRSDLSVPDGAGLLFTSRYILNDPIRERVTGIDLVYGICELAEKRKYPIFLLGGENGTEIKTAAALKDKFPNLIIAGTHEGFPELKKSNFNDFRQLRMTDIKPSKNDPNMEIIKKVHAGKPKILFVAYGAPKQDKFIFRYKDILNIPIMMGVGGSFDFISGKSSRAPIWIQKLWLEWLWRVFKEPWRINRIITATVKFPLEVIKNRLFGA